jgi:hypothetical protein
MIVMLSRIIVAAILVLLVSCFATAALAGGGGQTQSFYFSVEGIPGWTYYTGSSITANITPPFYQNGEGDVPYAAPLHSDNFTTAYWTTEGGQKLSTQCLSTPNPVGDLPFTAFVSVGANDTRSVQTFSWYIDNYQTNYTWFIAMYSVDTRHRVFMELVEPGGTNNYGSFTTRTSRGGYDLFATAFVNPSSVPEPGSMLALFAGLTGMAGAAYRSRRRH